MTGPSLPPGAATSPGSTSPPALAAPLGSTARVRAVPVRDEVVRDGASVVLHDGQVLHLSVIATTVRLLAADWVTVADLVSRVEEEVGPAPDGEGLALLTSQLEELARLGLVEVAG